MGNALTASLPFERGQVLLSTPVGSTDFQLNLGAKYTTRNIARNLSGSSSTYEDGREVTLRVVRNVSGAALDPRRSVKYKTGSHGTEVDGYCDPYASPEYAGTVDDAYAYTTVTVPNNGIFYIIEDGPREIDGSSIVSLPVLNSSKMRELGWHGASCDFASYLAKAPFAITTDSGGSQACQDVVGGVVLLTSDSTDEDETILHTEGAQFLFAENKPIHFGARIKVGEVSTDKNNVSVGLVSGNVNAAIGDAGAGPPSSYSGALFFKVDSGTVWQAETSVGSTQSTDTDCGTRSTSAYTDLRCVIFTTSSTSATAKFYIDGSLVHTGTFTYTGAAQMRFIVGTHNGTGSADTLYVDYMYCWQLR